MVVSNLEAATWLTTAGAEIFLCVMLWRARIYKTLPIFFAFIAFLALSEIAQIVTYKIGYAAYFYTYWVTVSLRFLIQFAVLHEIVAAMLKPFRKIPAVFTFALTASVLIACVVSVAVSISAQSSITHRLMSLLVGLQRTTLTAWCASFVAVSLCTSWMGLGWNRTLLKCAIGTCLLNVSGMITGVLFNLLCFAHYKVIIQMDSIVWNVVLFGWILSFRKAFAEEAQTGVAWDKDIVREAVRTVEVPMAAFAAARGRS